MSNENHKPAEVKGGPLPPTFQKKLVKLEQTTKFVVGSGKVKKHGNLR